MILSQTGKIAPDVYALGHPAIPIYLLDGPAPAVFDAGVAFLADRYVRDIKQVLDSRQPDILFLTHMHFDHCGAAAALKKAFPRMQVAASQPSAELAQNPGAIERIEKLNQAAAQAAVEFGIDHPSGARFEPFIVDRLVGDQESIELSPDLHVRAIASPGHTRDCFSYLIEEKQFLISSEALGQEHRKGVIISDCLADYDAYYASLRKLAALQPAVVCPGHFFVYTAGDARRYPERAEAACRQFRILVETLHQQKRGDLQQVMQQIQSIEYDGNPAPRQPEVAYRINLEARIKAVLNAGP